jgi:transposase
MATTTIAQTGPRVTVGVDTHKDVHVAKAKDELGRPLGEKSVPATATGYQELLAWARGLGELEAFGIEGTGSYGAGLARFLLANEVTVFEVVRPNRQRRRRNGKSDPADADAAASAVLSGEASAIPKAGDGDVEMIRMLRIARKTAVKSRTQAINAMKALIVTAPSELREALPRARRSVKRLVQVCGAFRPGALDHPLAACKLALRSLARRCQALETEIAELNAALATLVRRAAPQLISHFAVGTETAATLLVVAGDNPDRLHSDAAFSSLCGASPVEASSGKIVRHRLNRGGNREANAALHRVVLVRLRWHQPTRDYVERRTKEGLSKREIMRCLKRYVAREVYRTLSETNGAGGIPVAAPYIT